MPTTSPATLLIADCGATSGKWALVDRATGCARRFVTGPVNPAVYNPSHIAATLAEASGRLPMPPDAVAIYAAGAIGPGAQMLAREAAAAFGLRIEAVSVDTDLAGAATALFGTEREWHVFSAPEATHVYGAEAQLSAICARWDISLATKDRGLLLARQCCVWPYVIVLTPPCRRLGGGLSRSRLPIGG